MFDPQALYDATRYPLVRHNLLQSGLADEPDEAVHAALRGAVEDSPHVVAIASEQLKDGSWGRFHSMLSTARKRYHTTEAAAWRLHEMGLRRGFRVVDDACAYMERLLEEPSLWPDAWEKREGFAEAVPLFVASKLALFGCDTPAYREAVAPWLEALEVALEGGAYDGERLNRRSKAKMGIRLHNLFCGPAGLNNLILYRAHRDEIPAETQRALLRWLRGRREDIPYTGLSLAQPFDALTRPNRLNPYVRTLGLLSGLDGFSDVFADHLAHLAALRGPDGYWDLDRRFDLCRLADSWRRPADRRADQTICLTQLNADAMRGDAG